MSLLQFKTNINCTGCLSKVSPVLNELASIKNWEVDLKSEDRVLTIDSKTSNKEEIIQTISNAGFHAENLIS